MGTVVRAYDPKLRREVALKRLTPNALDRDGEARLVREAQSMAKLSHPNVVAIYDVEVGDEGVTMVMEYVAGPTLRTWLRDTSPAWRDVLAAFRQAGEGVAAAHQVGLVHRDFKPGNVLVAPDGRVKVTDFGLAKSARSLDVDEIGGSVVGDADSPSLDVSASSDSLAFGAAGDDLTRADLVMGTPPYMAPEQHTGHVPDARADQYAFCVSLWLGLQGTLPFRGPPRELLDLKVQGPPPWPKGSDIPGHIAEAIRRGLAAEPDDRWPSMATLLGALTYDPGASRRRVLGVTGGLASLALVLGVPWLVANSEPTPCTGGPAQLQGVWDGARREQIERGLIDTGVAFAPATAERVQHHLDGYAEGWIAQHRDACEATAVRGDQSSAVLDLRMSCLQHAKLRLVAVTEVLSQPDADVVSRAVALVRGLPSVDHCGDAVQLQSQNPPPSDADTSEAVEVQRAALARAQALVGVGRYADASQLAEEIETAAIELDFAPFLAEAKAFRGAASIKDGKYDQAHTLLDEALRLAVAHGQTALASEIATDLVLLTADRLGRPDEGHAWGSVALGLAQARDPGGRLEASALSATATVLRAQGRYREAVAVYERVLEIERGDGGEDDPRLAVTLSNLASNLRALGRFEEAESAAREAQAMIALVHGPEHPSVAATMNTVAGVLLDKGDAEGAEKMLRQSIDLRRRALGTDHPLVAASLDNLAGVLGALGRFDEAVVVADEAFDIAERTLGPDNPEMALFHANTGALQAETGREQESIVHFRRAIEIQAGAYSPTHASLVMPLSNLGQMLVAVDRVDEGIVQLERAWELAGSDEVAPQLAGRTGVTLADVLWTRPADRAHAIEIVRAVQARLQTVEPGEDQGLAAVVEAWLAEHPLPSTASP
jgi:tetratricopeptide (TPR) repeat protein